MNRFFSKLDLRDIKIDPESTHFPPDDDENEPVEPVAVQSEEREIDDLPLQVEAVEHDPVPVSQNGHLTEDAIDAVVTQEAGDEVLKVSARSRPSAVAGAIAGVVREFGRAEVQAIGAGATNQAVKAAAIARDYLQETGIDAVCLPAFIDVTIDNEDRTAMRLVIEPR